MPVKPFIFCCFLLVLSSCSTVKKTTSGNFVDPEINNIVWQVISFQGHPLDPSKFSNGLPNIVFNMQDGRINGNDGCNSFMGLATYHKNVIKTGPIASTKMACPGTDIAQDFYLQLSSPHLTYHLNDGTLRLFVNDAEVMALKEKQ